MDAGAAIVDVLRRAGASVTVASVESGLQVSMSRNVQIVADKAIQEVAGESFDLIALPVSCPLSPCWAYLHCCTQCVLCLKKDSAADVKVTVQLASEHERL